MILTDRRVEALWKSAKFKALLRRIIFDEAHCISEWSGADFRPDYGRLGRLQWLMPKHARFYFASATMPPKVLREVRSKMHLYNENCTMIQRSNDRTNIVLGVRKMVHPQNSFQDLAFLIPDRWKPGDPPPPKFMVFANSRNETREACLWLREATPVDLRNKFVWFHSGMSSRFREKQMERLKSGAIWGVFCTDAAGMVSQATLALSFVLINHRDSIFGTFN